MSDHPVLQQASRLRATLETLAAALSSGDALAVLDVEPQLAAAMSARSAPRTDVDDATREALGVEIERARHALARCRATGTAATHLVTATLDALRGGAVPYGRHGETAESQALRGRGVEARG